MLEGKGTYNVQLGEQRDGDDGEQAHDVHDVGHGRRSREVDATIGGRGLKARS